MITPPKRRTLELSQVLSLLAALLLFPYPLASAAISLVAVVILILGCSLKRW